MKTAKPKFKVGDWVTFISGPNKGKSTTLVSRVLINGSWVYNGYFCGELVSGKEDEIGPYQV